MAERAGVDGAELVTTLVAFARELRAEGVKVGSGDVLGYARATSALDPADLVDLFHAGRTTLVTRRDQLPVYDRVFRRFFLDEPDEPGPGRPFTAQARAEAQAVLEVPETERTGGEEDERETELGLAGSLADTLKHKAFAACTADELAALRRIMRRIRLAPPRRRSRRTAPGRVRRAPDLRRTVRETMRTHGEPPELFWRERRRRPRPLVLILDVSGSMADYSRSLLQFAHVAARAATRVEVFCFGTRLTRITHQLEHRSPDEALARAAEAVFDFDGGTRIGESLETFVREWGRRGTARGGIVVVCSDGLDRGDPDVLARALERLTRQCHRLVWLSPTADAGPPSLGMLVAEPYVDALMSGHDLAGLEEFAAGLAALG